MDTRKPMKDYKKAIEEAAHEDFSYGAKSSVGSGTRSMYENKKQSFIHGAKSEAAAEYWQNKLYPSQTVIKSVAVDFAYEVQGKQSDDMGKEFDDWYADIQKRIL